MGIAAAPLSVGMPVFNAERYVAQAIESILTQTFADLELIISDNASTDGTEEICRAYASKDRRVKYSRLAENGGAAPNFNRVFSLNRSPLFKFAAADDACEPDFLKTCIAVYQDAPNSMVLCFPATVGIDASGRRLGLIQEDMNLRDTAPSARFQEFLRKHSLANCFYGVVRTEAYASTRLHQAYRGADMVLLSELALRGQFWQVDEPLFLRRFHDQMSQRLFTDAADLRKWHDQSARGVRALPRTRMSWGYLRAIDLAPISLAERMRCRQAFVTSWLSRRWKTILWEVAAAARVRA